MLSLVAGIFGILTGFIAGVLGIISILRMGKNAKFPGQKLAIAGIILGGTAIVLWVSILDWQSILEPGKVRKTQHMTGPAHLFPWE